MLKKPKYKIGRRLGAGVYEKCQTAKFTGSRGGTSKVSKRGKAMSEYGTQLIEKQKIRYSYGITERQLSNYVKEASGVHGAGTSDKFFELLETRLDNAVYRMGLVPTRRAARQAVSHGHFVVAGRRVTIPSYALKVGDVVSIREGSKTKKIFAGLAEKIKEHTTPTWLSFDVAKHEGKVLAVPKERDSFIDLNAVLEFYSR